MKSSRGVVFLITAVLIVAPELFAGEMLTNESVVSMVIVRLKDKKPAFYTKATPSSFLLVKFAYQPAKDMRYTISTGGKYKSTIPFKYSRKNDEIFELYPEGELEQGEYASVSSMSFHDFGID